MQQKECKIKTWKDKFRIFCCKLTFFFSLHKIFVGYLNDEKATSETIVDGGWLRTGDLAHFDNEGYLYILDRLKDTIKYKGFQVQYLFLEIVK